MTARLPKVSVCIPAFNHARYIGRALESALSQTMDNIEVLVVDDASTDETFEVAGRYAASDGRVRLYRSEANLGMVRNWNRCLRDARGTYVKLLCSDDFLEPACLETQAKVLDDLGGVAVVSCARRLVEEDGAETGVASYAETFVVRPGKDVINDCFHRVGNLIGEPCAVLFRREAAGRGFHTAYRQLTDLEMWFHLLERGDFAHVPDALCGFRRHPGQQTRASAANLAFADDEFRLFEEYSGKEYITLSLWQKQGVRYNKALLVWNRRFQEGGEEAALKKISEHYPLALFRLITLGKRLFGA
ncbi:MAG: glycosyltransferase [Actinobacteria bacterium]|nr:glycosyltransferase [Actinomycetota bacterium]MBM2827691.1 glycosyltransferase [Actinomycetota bacterium]